MIQNYLHLVASRVVVYCGINTPHTHHRGRYSFCCVACEYLITMWSSIESSIRLARIDVIVLRTITQLGYRWFSEGDIFLLDIGVLTSGRSLAYSFSYIIVDQKLLIFLINTELFLAGYIFLCFFSSQVYCPGVLHNWRNYTFGGFVFCLIAVQISIFFLFSPGRLP